MQVRTVQYIYRSVRVHIPVGTLYFQFSFYSHKHRCLRVTKCSTGISMCTYTTVPYRTSTFCPQTFVYVQGACSSTHEHLCEKF